MKVDPGRLYQKSWGDRYVFLSSEDSNLDGPLRENLCKPVAFEKIVDIINCDDAEAFEQSAVKTLLELFGRLSLRNHGRQTARRERAKKIGFALAASLRYSPS